LSEQSKMPMRCLREEELVDDGFDDHFRTRCCGNNRLKVSKIAAEFFDKLKVLAEIKNKTAS